MAIPERRRLGDILIEAGLISEEAVAQAIARQKETSHRLGQTLVELGMVTPEQIAAALSAQLGIPYVRLADYSITPELIQKVPERVARQHKLLPIEEVSDKLIVAVADPLDITALDDLQLMLGLDIEPVIAAESDVMRAIEQLYGVPQQNVEQVLQELTENDVQLIQDVDGIMGGQTEQVGSETPVIRLVNMIILQALKDRASDIHVEPFEHRFQVRERIDGVLKELPSPPRALQPGIISRVKVMADLNIAETRLPQDGRIRVKLAGKEIDIRVSALPTMFGESIVLRLLDRTASVVSIAQLGFQPDDAEKFKKNLAASNGIVLVTGPTGSGKTTTLYAGVQEINTPDIKLITVEDPVEYELHGLVQCQVNEKVGMTFAAALRSILRQDPDIILIGEIRDAETAGIAIQSALTGHLVLATAHTNEAAGAITRLIDMGCEPFLLTSSIRAIIGQRLVRKICPGCREQYEPLADDLKKIGKNPEEFKGQPFFRGRGCTECAMTGFRGRIGIYELLELNNEIADLVVEKQPANVIHKKALDLGMRPMREDGWTKVVQGLTSLDEVLRVAPIETGIAIKE